MSVLSADRTSVYVRLITAQRDVYIDVWFEGQLQLASSLLKIYFVCIDSVIRELFLLYDFTNTSQFDSEIYFFFKCQSQHIYNT